MKQLVLLAGFAVLLAGLLGCQDENKVNDVKIDGGNEFPEFLVGTWKADRFDWAINFESDGSISSVVHTLWALPLNLEEGGFYVEGKLPGTYAIFVIGDCKSDYNPATRQLSATINLESYEIKMPNDTYRGKSEDHFDGPVSEDGKTWNVEWRGYGYLEDATPPDVNFINENPEPLVFSKVEAD